MYPNHSSIHRLGGEGAGPLIDTETCGYTRINLYPVTCTLYTTDGCTLHPVPYSTRSADIGGILLARPAGSNRANTMTTSSSAVTPTNVRGSVGSTL